MTYRILVVRLGSLGDVVLTSAAVLNLKLAYPDSHLAYLTKTRFAPVVRLMTGVDEVLCLPEDVDTQSFVRLLLELDKSNFDLVVDLHGNFRSWLTRKLVAAGNTVSYPKRRLDRWLTVKHLQAPDSPPHTIDLYNSALEQAGIAAIAKRPVIHHKNLGNFPSELSGLKNPVIIAPGAAHPTKQWPVERFIEVARQLIDRHDAHILWTAVGADRLPEQARILLGDYCTELIDWPIEQLAPVLAQTRVVISNDSGLMHLASAVGTPVVAIFGPTHPSLGFSPRGLHDRIIEVDEYCRPCSLHGKAPCHRTEQFCFTRVTPEMVLSAAGEMLAKPLRGAVLCDRDGTLIADKHYLADPDQVELIPGAPEALKAAREAGYRLVVLSNQSGVARGYFSVGAVEAVHGRFEELLAKAGVALDAAVFCPHYPGGTVPEYAISCDCRKPRSGMAEQAALALNLNLHRSFVIGDKLDDINLGLVTGATPLLVRTGHGKQTEDSLRGLYNGIRVYNSVLEAVQSLRNHSQQ